MGLPIDPAQQTAFEIPELPARLREPTVSVPPGTEQRSPPRQRWEHGIEIAAKTRWQRAPQGRNTSSTEHVLRLVFDAVPLQNRPKLLLKTDLAMMRLLILYVSDYRVQARGTHAESAVAFLPGKLSPLFAHPFRGVRFQQKNGFRQRKLGRQVKQQMHMILRAAYRERYHPVILANPGQIRPQSRLPFPGDRFPAFPGTENHVKVVSRKGMGHCAAPFGASCYLNTDLPALARWATLFRP